MHEQATTGLEVALIGMSTRFPGARNAGEFWRNLCQGIESITFFSDEELERSGVDRALYTHPNYVRAAPVLDQIEDFDAEFFGFSPREAEITDPQHRILLECAWEALEDAGYDPERFPGPIGVYAGTAFGQYLYNILSDRDLVASMGLLKVMFANDKDYLATRIAYKLNLEGPAVTVQTACSTSLVAVHLACQALISGECEMALAGGIAIKVPHRVGYLHQEGEFFSPDGHCRAFDANAAGTISGSGGGIVVLRRLEDALAARDSIYAVIKGSAINNDGAHKVGYSAPRADGQAKVIRAAQVAAEVDPATLGFIEGHGTGTALGDPIEVNALTRVFRASTPKRRFCALGSVKTNIGHLDTAAGVAGLVKAALAVREGLIPATLHSERPLPDLESDDSPFFVPTRLTEWPAGKGLRRAAVSSFGVGGTNAHLILEQAPEPEPVGASRAWSLLPLSARSPQALEAMTANLADHLRRNPSLSLADAAYTLQTGRRAFAHRRAVVARGVEDAVRALEAAPPAGHLPVGSSKELPVWFLFPGQGAQHPGMARQVYESEPIFRLWVDLCAETLRPRLGLDLRQILFPAPERLEEARRQLEQTQVAQVALFAVEYALAQLWMDWGIRPRALLGHSIGEYVAACLSGVLSFDDALLLVADRGRLMQGLPPGAMLAVNLPEEEAAALAGPDVSLATVNAPHRSVLSGPPEAIDALARDLTARGVEHHRLHTSHAFHSAMMEPILEAFAERLGSVPLSPPGIPYLSNLTGTWIRNDQATDPAYWCRHLRSTVRFGPGLRELLQRPDGILLEVGPGQMLTDLARQNVARGSALVILSSLPRPQEDRPELACLLGALGGLWTAGVEPDWKKVSSHPRRRRIGLPTYPFERRRCWIDRAALPVAGTAETRPDPLRRLEAMEDWFSVPSWRRTPVPEPAGDAFGPTGLWVVLADEVGVGERLARSLGGALVVRAGDRFARLGEGTFTVNPRDPEGYGALLDEVAASGRRLAGVLHLWTLTPPEEEEDRLGRLQALQPLGYGSLVALAQAAARRGLDAALRVELVTNGLYEVTGDEALVPEKATLLGPLLVIPQEHPGARCRAIDVRLGTEEGPGSLDRLAEMILAEVRSRSGEPLVAYRGRYRWVRSFEPLPLAAPEATPVRLREEGVYVITGGLGGLGLTFAEHLGRGWRARLALIGRTPLPERARWERAIAEGDAVAPLLRRLLALEKTGARVLALSADVTRPEELRRALEEVRRDLGPVRGVIHAAGVPGGGLLQVRRDEEAERVLAPKVRGTLELARELAGDDLDFLLLCSSTLALTGGVGQADYCAANSFLDAFAHERSRAGRLTLSVNWDQWRRVGMAARAESEWGLLGSRVLEAAGQVIYAGTLSAARHWALDEHRVLGRPVLPGTAHLELIAAAAADAAGADPGQTVEIRNAVFLAPLVVEDGSEREVRVVVDRESQGLAVRVLARAEGGADWHEHAVAQAAVAAPGMRSPHDVAALWARVREGEPPPPAADGETLHWGPRWRSVRRVGLGDSEALAELEIPAGLASDADAFRLHPALLDVATSFALRHVAKGTFVPFSYERLAVHGRLPGHLISHVRRWQGGGPEDEQVRFDLALLDKDGVERVEIEGFTMRRVEEADFSAVEAGGGLTMDGHGLSPEEGVEAFSRILAQAVPGPQVIVATRNLQALIELAARPAAASLDGTEPPPWHARHQRPNLSSEYVSPRTETERILAEIEQELLGLDRIGIHDNFFEIGGDSMIGVQVFARATQAGLKLTTGQLFQNQTIAELAAAADGAVRDAGTPAPPTGALPISPVQAELLERGPGQAMWRAVLDLLEEVDTGRLAAVASALAERHPALRLRFALGEEGWRQSIEPAGGVPQLRLASLDGTEGGSRLMAEAHGAAVDAWSWPVLLEDLRALMAGGDPAAVPDDALGAWSEVLAERAASEALPREREEWIETLRKLPRLPAEGGEPEDFRVESWLDPESTRSLLDRVPPVYRTETLEVLAAALALALCDLTGEHASALTLEKDGRAELPGVAAARAVGCFAYRFPVLLEPGSRNNPGAALRSVKDRIRLTPGGGIGYGLLRRKEMPDASLGALHGPEILLRWIGTAGAWPQGGGAEHLLEVTAGVEGGALRLVWDLRRSGLRRSTVDALSRDALAALRELIDHCRSAEGAYTISDFREAELSPDDFEDILARFEGADQDSFDD